jgi:hypothetical protein
MGRGLGLVTLVVGLVVSAVLLASQWTSIGSSSGNPRQSRPVQEANTAAATVAAMQAERELAVYQTEHATYVGAVTHIPGVTILRADAATYCLQIAAGDVTLYDAGPGGGVTAQRC